jgi:hypothetical protein
LTAPRLDDLLGRSSDKALPIQLEKEFRLAEAA